MINTALIDVVDVIQMGLARKAATIPSRWANLYVKIEDPKTKELNPYSFRYHPWTVEMWNTPKSWVGPKAAQMGYTQSALGRALFLIDVRKTSVLYLLPKKSPDATDFSKSRFDPIIDQSPHLKSIFTDVNNIGHKKAGPASLFVRGMRSKSGVKSLPVGCVIFDEFDEMPMANVAQAEQRMAGQFEKQNIKISTPTIPNKRIDGEYNRTTKEHYFFRCPRCNQWTEFDFPEALVLYTDDPADDVALAKSHYRCPECRGAIYHEEKPSFLTTTKAMWYPTANANASVRGFHINQYYSFTETPATIGKLALLARDDPEKEQEYWNSAGGMARIPDGNRLTEDHIIAALGTYRRGQRAANPNRIITMGVDIGKKIHFVITEWRIPEVPGADLNTAAVASVLTFGFVDRFEELDDLIIEWGVRACVVDANPERRKAEELSNRFLGYVWMCLYQKGISENTILKDDMKRMVRVDRTNWLDTTLGRFHQKRITLPSDTDKEFKDHLQSIIKWYTKDTTGNPVARYINDGADHYAHAMNYSEIALPLATSMVLNRNVEDFL